MKANPTTSTYEIVVSGHLDDHWSAVLGGLGITREHDGTSSLRGPVADQAQLHGVLNGLRNIGATLLSISTAPDATPAIPQPVRTERLTLRAATEADADATWAYRRLESVAMWLTALPTDVETYRTTFADPGRLSSTVIIELDGEVIGDLMLRVQDPWSQAEVVEQARGTQAELGWVLDPAHTGRGYAREAVRALLRVCFEELGIRRVIAICFLDNEASWRLMEGLGMRREAHAVRESLHRSGRWLDSLTYAVLADEWSR